jgi:hypothetical protein
MKEYFTPADFKDGPRRAAIRSVELETIDSEARVVLYFDGHDKGLVLTREMARDLTEAFGPHPLVEQFFPKG